MATETHQITKSCKKEWKCQQCDQVFGWRRHYDKHLEGHRNNNCHLCDEVIAIRKQFVLHMAEQHQIILKEENLKCEYCELSFAKKLVLYNHYKKEHAGSSTVCMRCGGFMKSKEDEIFHREKHEKERPWKCQICNASFLRRQQYLIHKKAHETHICNICDSSFPTKLKLTTHQREVHEDRSQEPSHLCSYCDQNFSRPSLLELHIRTHAGEKPIFCKECNKNFRSPRGYAKHLKTSLHAENTATDETNHPEPSKCSKTLVKKDLRSLVKHQRKAQSYKCEHCSFTSNSRDNTKRHQSLHTESRQFICEQCGGGFFTHGALIDHCKYRHSQTRQFQCDQCVQAFKTNSALNMHLRTHSDVRSHVCHCGQSYKRSSHLRRHSDSAHGPSPRSKKVQRLRRDSMGELVPVVEEAKKKPTKPAPIDPILSLLIGDNMIQVSYQPQLVFTPLEPSQDIIHNNLVCGSNMYVQEDESDVLTNCLVNSNPMLGSSSADLLFSCQESDHAALPEYQSNESTFLNMYSTDLSEC